MNPRKQILRNFQIKNTILLCAANACCIAYCFLSLLVHVMRVITEIPSILKSVLDMLDASSRCLTNGLGYV